MFDKPRKKRTWGELFAHQLGWGESRGLSIWFMISILRMLSVRSQCSSSDNN